MKNATITSSMQLPSIGKHIARCFKVIDLGTQTYTYNGRVTRARKLMVYWELYGAMRRENGHPFVISKIYTSSMHAKASLRKDVECWRGLPLMAQEAIDFDTDWMLDRYCLLTVGHAEINGKLRAVIERLTPLPDDFARPEPVNRVATFDLAAPDLAALQGLSKGVRNMVEASHEWNDSALAKLWREEAAKPWPRTLH